jgi:hypothetical protein
MVSTICPMSTVSCILCQVCEVEKPNEVVRDHKDARKDEGWGCERDERPGVRKVLQIDDMTQDGK